MTDPGDVATWATAGVAVLALIVSAVSAAFSWKSLRWERLSAEAAGRSAEAAERANRLAERALERVPLATGFKPPTLEEIREIGDLAQGVSSADGVRWRIERPSDNRYVLRNVGTETAEHVEVDPTQISAITRHLPRDAVLRPGEGADILIMGAFGHPVPNQLYIRWEGHPEWLAVPIT